MNIIHEIDQQRILFAKRTNREPSRLIITRDRHRELRTASDIMRYASIQPEEIMGMLIVVTNDCIPGGIEVQ